MPILVTGTAVTLLLDPAQVRTIADWRPASERGQASKPGERAE